MNPFESDLTGYKKILRDRLLARKRKNSTHFSFSKMAEACGIQKTYLSKTFHEEHTHLNRDQVYLCCQFLGFDLEEKEKTLLLHERARTHLLERQRELDQILKEKEKKRQKIESHLKAKKVRDKDRLIHLFLDPEAQMVMLMLSLEKFKNRISRIQKALHLSEERLKEILTKLENLEIIQKVKGKDGSIRVFDKPIHLPKDSQFLHIHQLLMRAKMIERISTQKEAQDLNFSVLFTGNMDVLRKLREQFFALLKEAEELSKNSPSQCLYQMNFDLVTWSR